MIHGFWHAGNYDKNDFLGRLINNRWVKTFEKSLAQAIDYNWFASDYHLNMFRKNFGFKEIELFRTGWPMEYLNDMFEPKPKENIILFPHRIAPEKQVRIFKDLAKELTEYEFIVCQEQNLSKSEYHDLLERSKIVFSANLQETLGISCYEGALAGALPMVPDRLSYSEMYSEEFKYPSEWTKSWRSYQKYKKLLISEIVIWMSRYDEIVASEKLNKLTTFLHENYFSCNGLKRVLFDGK
jgi:glycosyltransferase involved in cell wall biosynthesis